jgi:PAS domain S-box-containing protein
MTRQDWDADAWAIQQVETASAPAFVARGDGTLVAANGLAGMLIDGRKVVAELLPLIEDTYRADKTQVVRFALKGRDGETLVRRFDLTFISLTSASVFVVAREVTIETNLISALTASRELFRDLALCSTDFAFETDGDGILTWVSPEGALGYSATELHGSHPREVFGDVGGTLKFSSRQTVRAEEISCVAKTGEEHRILLTVLPVVDAQGRFRGTRGGARDVTDLRRHEREAEIASRREELIGAIVGAMRGQIEPRRMMLAAAEALLAATDSHRVTVRPVRLSVYAKIGETDEGVRHEVGFDTSYQGTTNGRLLLARNGDGPAYGEAERALVEAVVPHLGVAIALAELLTAAIKAPGQ